MSNLSPASGRSLAFDRKAGSYDTHAHVQRDTAAWVALMRQLHGTGATVVGDPLPAGRLRTLLNDYEATCRRAEGVPATWTFCRLEAGA